MKVARCVRREVHVLAQVGQPVPTLLVENDVTIQPLGVVDTNLFIYTGDHVYGFLLTPRNYGNYDDIVNVSWRQRGLFLKPPKRKKTFVARPLKRSMQFGVVKVVLNQILVNKKRGSHIIEFTVQNDSLKKVNSKEFDLYLTRSGKRLLVQEFAIKDDLIKPLSSSKGRVFLKLEEKRGFTMTVNFKGKSNSLIISRRSL